MGFRTENSLDTGGLEGEAVLKWEAWQRVRASVLAVGRPSPERVQREEGMETVTLTKQGPIGSCWTYTE